MAGGCWAVRYSPNCRLTDLLLAGTAKPGGRGFVGRDVAGELVRARVAGPQHEIESVGVVGGVHRADGGEAGVGDGPRRQAGMAIGVVGGGAIQVGLVDDLAKEALQE